MTANKCVSEEEAIAEEYVNFIAGQSTPRAVTLERVQAETAHDKMLQALIALIHSQADQCGWHDTNSRKHGNPKSLNVLLVRDVIR